ncbi:hypothetical protein FMN50_02945 [Rhodobacterales bacterium]|nr:hypothetical protein FMN50_02945 [Rhodobacterales bacterium]
MFFRPPRHTVSLAAAVSLVALQSNSALAFDPSGNEVADAFLNLLEAEQGTVESYGSVDNAGDTVTIKDLVLTDEDDKDTKVTIATTTLKNGEVNENGRLKLQELGMQDLSLAADDGGMTLESLTVTDLLLPTAEELSPDTAPVGPAYKSLTVRKVAISDEDGKIADIETIQSAIEAMDGDLPTAGNFSITGAVVDVKELDTAEHRDLEELGYEKVSFDVSASGNWDPEAATLAIPELKVDAKDAGKLTLSLTLGGVTREVVTKINQQSQKPEEAMALLQNVTVDNAKIRFDDASLTGRILDQEAEKAGVETPVYVQRLTGTLPMMLGMLQNKELETQVATAVSEFLTTPGSLEITAAPGAPVPIAQIFGTAMLAPQMIPQILAVGINANQ